MINRNSIEYPQTKASRERLPKWKKYFSSSIKIEPNSEQKVIENQKNNESQDLHPNQYVHPNYVCLYCV